MEGKDEHSSILPENMTPGYPKDAGFRFQSPLVSKILQNDVMARQCEMPSIIQHGDTKQFNNSRAIKPALPPNTHAIGGLRKIMKRMHTPAGVVMHYESKLREFLNVDSDGDCSKNESTRPQSENGVDDAEWQMIEEEEAVMTPLEKALEFDGDLVVLLNRAIEDNKDLLESNRTSPEITAGIKSKLVTEWSIENSFTRLIVHTMCRYYGLVSFTEVNEDRNGTTSCVLRICHPRFFKDVEVIKPPSVTFSQFLYNQ